MSKLESLKDGLIEELKDLYSAENQLLKALPKMAKKAASPKLKEAFTSHLEETKGQVERLQNVAEIVEEKLSGKTCKAMQGLIEEGKEILEEESDNEALLDCLLIGAARRVEHYEIAAYSTAIAMAKHAGEAEVAKILAETLNEEDSADKKLFQLADTLLAEANSAGEDDNSDEPVEEDEDDEVETARSKKSKGNGAALRLVAAGLLSLSLSLAKAVPASAESPAEAAKHEQEAASYKPDNSGVNVRDRNENRKTADDQKGSDSDVQVLAEIRKTVVARDDLSTYGKNVKIMVEGGVVTLRGPVKSSEEKSWIGDQASRIAKGYKVDNRLEVAPG